MIAASFAHFPILGFRLSLPPRLLYYRHLHQGKLPARTFQLTTSRSVCRSASNGLLARFGSIGPYYYTLGEVKMHLYKYLPPSPFVGSPKRAVRDGMPRAHGRDVIIGDDFKLSYSPRFLPQNDETETLLSASDRGRHSCSRLLSQLNKRAVDGLNLARSEHWMRPSAPMLLLSSSQPFPGTRIELDTCGLFSSALTPSRPSASQWRLAC
ncbi:hypothetical protein F4808DRAFT_98720 [Astrocystis sublimbata]|nr:hypothetical protein F4808DRAFT_98720 [Astrocystis sublimbata]